MSTVSILAIPFALVGSVWLMYLLDYNWSIAVWVGVIALAGLAAETGVVMVLFLDLAWREAGETGRMGDRAELMRSIATGAVQRIRPMTMTVTATLLALVPILWATGTGADVMKRLAAPMVGGLVTAFVGVLVAVPVLYFFWRSRSLAAGATGEGP